MFSWRTSSLVLSWPCSFRDSALLPSSPLLLSIKWQICDIRRKEFLFSENPSTIQSEHSLASLDATFICNPNTVDRRMQNYGGPGLGHGSTLWGKQRRMRHFHFNNTGEVLDKRILLTQDRREDAGQAKKSTDAHWFFTYRSIWGCTSLFRLFACLDLVPQPPSWVPLWVVILTWYLRLEGKISPTPIFSFPLYRWLTP